MQCIPRLVIHGGAGNWDRLQREEALTVIREALIKGQEVLSERDSLHAVVTSIHIMEESGVFNAGKGSVKDEDGHVTMDAGLMTSDMRVGSAILVRGGSAIEKALRVLEENRHVIISFYDEEEQPSITGEAPDVGDTVGAIAVDRECMMASGTSTGGIRNKKHGRVGDSPVPGSGFYASEYVAVSSTGIGEYILRIMPAKEISTLVSLGFPLDVSVSALVSKMTRQFGEGNFGVIALDRHGNYSVGYNTHYMPWGTISNEGIITSVRDNT